MFLTRKHLSRRTVLKGAGATIALPLLDAMIPAGTALAQTAAAPSTRVGFVYFPCGALQDEWQPKKVGRNFDFPYILQPLEPFRDYVTVVSGLRNKAGEGGVPHAIVQETWLNGVHPRQRNVQTGFGVTADQVAARHLTKDVTLPSMEICGEAGGMISFRTPNQPLPMEVNPRKVFLSMFGQGATQQERRSILGTTTSLLDYVRDASASLNRRLDAADRTKVGNYLDSVREVEQRVQKLMASNESLTSLPDAPIGPPDDFGELLDVQFEMFALAWQTGRTNVVTMKMAEEATMRTYPNLGVHEAFHPTSHWGGYPERIANLRKIQNYHTSVFAKFVKRLAETPDGNGSLLDHSIILFGSNMANSDAHNNDPLPQALIGRGGGVKGGQHLHYPQDTPHANLLVTILERAGVPPKDFQKFGDATGPLSEV
ncbi:MAG TPA: DUF1552 domain-containing protein [Gammaproteobacteria bacterium]|jgi:hypothetical protein|nr:DUF1552 domain-containing protein [Gammaproteobacteria bacterium]